ncbi:hypothetical protein FBQ82_16025 [Anaerolineae bacterium CFX7]|nr:hypothetical protein [Anaerolineae bacterium CFX7]
MGILYLLALHAVTNAERGKMHKFSLTCVVVVVAAFAGLMTACSFANESGTRDSHVANTQNSALNNTAPVSEPKPQFFELSENPRASKAGFDFSVQLVATSPKQTIMLYSMTAPESVEARDFAIDLIETGKSRENAKENSILEQFDKLRFGVLKFDPPSSRGAEFILRLDSPQTGPLELNVTKNTNLANSESPLNEGDRSIISREGSIEQGDYLVSFNGFGLYTRNLQADQANAQPRTQEEDLKAAQTRPAAAEPQQTPAPVEPRKITQELAEGKEIWSDASFRIENRVTKEVKILYVVILEDGQVKSRILE